MTAITEYLNNLYDDINTYEKENKVLINKIDKNEFENFKIYMLSNIDRLKYSHSFSGYNKLEKNIRITKKDLLMNDKDLKILYLAKKNMDVNCCYERTNTIMKTHIYPKSKKKKLNIIEENPNDNRYLFDHSKFIKILDKLWLLELDNLTNNIFGMLIKDMFYVNTNIKNLAVKITNDPKNLLLLDLKKAFDSVKYNTIKILLGRFFERNKIDNKYLEQYMFMLNNRKCYYRCNKKSYLIKINKGIPTGLASSTFVFSVILNEIFLELFEKFDYNEYFNFYIYVDDICVKIKDENNKYLILLLFNDLNNLFTKYGLILNEDKCKISPNLKGILKCGFINNEEMYLGIPFERREYQYKKIILNQFNERYNTNYTFNEFFKSNNRSVKGFLNYKYKDIIFNDNKSDLHIIINKYIILNILSFIWMLYVLKIIYF
jgi:hypothetical protein